MDYVELGYQGGAAEAGINGLKRQIFSINEPINRVVQHSEGIGETFLRSERRVSRSAANMVAGLLSAQNAGDVLAAVFNNLEKATKFGLGLGIGLAVGIGLFDIFHKSVEEVSKATKKLKADLAAPLSLQLQLSSADIKSQIATLDKDIEDLEKKHGSIVQGIIRFATGPSQGNIFAGESEHDVNVTRGDRRDLAEEAINSAIRRRKELIQGAAEASLKEAEIHKDALSSHEQMAALEQVEFDLQQKRAKLALVPFKSGDDVTARLKEWIALGIEADTASAKLERKFDLGQATSQAKFQTGAQDVDLARRQVTETGEVATADALETEIRKAQIMVGLADERLRIEGETQSAIDEQTSAINAEQIAIAKRDKNRIDTKFKDDQEITKSKTDNQITALQMSGQTFAANLLKTREATEVKIAQHLKDQKNELAQQDKIAGKLSITQQLGKQLGQSPGEAQAAAAAAAKEARDNALAAAQLKDAADREKRGAKLDENNLVTKALRAQQAIDRGEKPEQAKDFSSVASLAGQDFSSLGKLANQDFSGLARLAQLQIA